MDNDNKNDNKDINSDIVLFQSVFKIGNVISVNGREVRIKVDRDKNSSHLIYKGQLIKNVSVGSYLKILKGFIPIICKVESEYVQPNKDYGDVIYSANEDIIDRTLGVQLLGYFENKKYCRGVKELPLIDNDCFLLTNEEFKEIHNFVKNEKGVPLYIGTLASDSFVPIELGVNSLFSSHIGIFGNTGSGKSYTLSKLYRQLFMQYVDNDNFKKKAKFLFFDFNGEYSGENVIIKGKKIYNLSTRGQQRNDKIPLTNDDMLNLDLLCILANATEKTQRPFIKRCVDLFKKIEEDKNSAQDKSNPFKSKLQQQIEKILCMSDKLKGDLLIDYVEQILPAKYDKDNKSEVSLRSDIDFHNSGKYYYIKDAQKKPYENNISAKPELAKETILYKQANKFMFSKSFIDNFIKVMYLQLINDVLNNRAMNEHIAPAINKLKSVERDIAKLFDFPDQDKDSDFWNNNNIVVINLSNINLDSRKMIPMLVARKLYIEHKAKREEDLTYLNIIVDEAHNILSYQSNRESETWKDYRLEVFEEIIKEGRKYGVFMTIASQRPSDISSTMISQLHNYFIHRLVNEHDIEMINRTISYLDKVSVESLPILSTGVCVIAGLLAEMPIIVQIDKIEDANKPLNETIDVVSKWANN